MKRIYEIFRKTLETYIFVSINLDKNENIKNNININIPFVKHMFENFALNFNINLNIIVIGDNYIDYHHLMEDLGIILGLSLKFSSNNKKIKRYGKSNIILEDSKCFILSDLSNRSYLNYNIFYNRIYIGNFDIDLFYDFFLAFVNNFNINLYIFCDGFNIHHKIECIFKCLGVSLRKSLKLNKNLISTKGLM